jgi:hypothetical protein
VSLSAAHTRAQVEALIYVLQEELAQLPGMRLAALPHLMTPQQQAHLQHPMAASSSLQQQQQDDASMHSRL